MENKMNVIDRYLGGLKTIKKHHITFNDFSSTFHNESVSVEIIILVLYNKGYIQLQTQLDRDKFDTYLTNKSLGISSSEIVLINFTKTDKFRELSPDLKQGYNKEQLSLDL